MDEIFTLQRRVQWRIASALFHSLDLPVGHGWDKTVAKIPELSNESRDRLNEACRNHILCGDKNIRVYYPKHKNYEDILQKAVTSIDGSSLLTQAYPFTLSEDELAEVEVNAPEVVHTEQDDDVLYIVFASHKAVRVRETMDRDLLAEALEESNAVLAERILSSHEVFSVRIEHRHAYDVICIHKDKDIAEVRIDSFENLFPSLKVREVDYAHTAVLHRFSEICKSNYLTNQRNLYPAIDGLLKINEGNEHRKVRVTRFGYLGPTGICREERKLHGDVRSDPTHLAAFNANDDSAPLTPYDIEVQFPGGVLVDQPFIALALHGTETLARSEKPVLGEMTISKCLYESDFRRVAAEVYKRA